MMRTIGAISFAARRAQRGLSLVELMLIVVVAALLLGGALVPWSTLWVDDVYQQERDNINSIHRAIIGYAGSHRTTPRRVVVQGSATNIREFTVAGGRPYLPCPDIDGDGYEDRQGYDLTGNLPDLSAATTLTITASRNDFLRYGNCASIRGVLPWKTLGTPPADKWGNRYTYGVDALWSHSLVGFNQDMAIDSYDPRLTVVVNSEGNIAYQPRDGFPVTLTRTGLDYVFDAAAANDVSRQPPVVCSPGAVATVFFDTCEDRPALAGQIVNLSTVTVAVNAPRKNFAAAVAGNVQRDTLEGVPFVVVSHGKNGHGAVNHLVNITVALGVVCNAPIHSDTLNPGPQDIDAGFAEEAMNFPFAGRPQLPADLRYCPQVRFSAAAGDGFESREFVSWHRGNGISSSAPASGFDDIVTWRTRDELVEAMTAAGILPVDDLPVFRAY